MRGIYVHVPFCARKCAYCDFYSVVAGETAFDEFCALLAREMELFRAASPAEAARPADTVYFGGGTPTVLGTARLCALLSALRVRLPVGPGAEITVEANPGTVTEEGLAALRAAGFNRLSIGVQSFDPAALAVLGRIHGVEEVRAACRGARRARFSSVGFDLIFGIPGQTAAAWETDLERTVTFLPDHVSAYALAPEEGTPIHDALRRGALSLPPEEEVADMYEAARRILARAGYRRYEISNFARPGRECRHNMKYWRREEYVGLGPSAHGLLFPEGHGSPGVRTANPASFAAWAEKIRGGGAGLVGAAGAGPRGRLEGSPNRGTAPGGRGGPRGCGKTERPSAGRSAEGRGRTRRGRDARAGGDAPAPPRPPLHRVERGAREARVKPAAPGPVSRGPGRVPSSPCGAPSPPSSSPCGAPSPPSSSPCGLPRAPPAIRRGARAARCPAPSNAS